MTDKHTITIITPVYDGGHAYLGQAAESIRAQQLPEGWTWQWVVQEDGETGRPLAELPNDPRISTGTGRRMGAAVARTLGLARATGELVRPLDADDLLTEGALLRDIETLTEHPEIGWVVSSGLDLLVDGSQTPAPDDFPPGPLPEGEIYRHYAAGEHRVISCAVTAHTELVRAVGGWGALPASEDSSLLLALEAAAPGWMIAEPSMLYRKHATQSTRLAEFADPTERAARVASVLARADALRRTGWRWSPTPPRTSLTAM